MLLEFRRYRHILLLSRARIHNLFDQMMNEGWFAPTLNLTDIDPRCAELDYIQDDLREIDTDMVMSNNFAFGGINTSLIVRKFDD